MFAKRLLLFYGDQRTVSHFCPAKLLRSESAAIYDLFGWALPVPGLFHLKMQWIKMIHDHHYLEKDMSSPSTLAYFRELLCEEHVQPDNADFTLEELVLHCFHGKILVALFAELREYFELDPWKIRDSKEWDQPFNELTQRELESCIGEVA